MSEHQNNKQYFLVSQSKVGRPIGIQDTCPRGKSIKKLPIKEIQCKCGVILKGDGAFYNHIKGVHNGDPSYKLERKVQGRKKKQQQYNNESTSIECKIQSEFFDNQFSLLENQILSEDDKISNINLKFPSAVSFQEQNIKSSTFSYKDFNDNIVFTSENRLLLPDENYTQMEDYSLLNIFNKNDIVEQYNNNQHTNSNSQSQSISNFQEDDIIPQQ